MNKGIFKLDKSLSIVELENRQELTVASTSVEVSKPGSRGQYGDIDYYGGRCT